MKGSKLVKSGGKRRPPNAGKGRKRGSVNKVTASVKAALTEAFQRVRVDGKAGGVDSLVAWGDQNPADFYTLWAKLLPKEVEVSGKDGGPIAHTVTVRFVKP